MFVRIFSGVAGIRKALLLRIINSAQKKNKKGSDELFSSLPPSFTDVKHPV